MGYWQDDMYEAAIEEWINNFIKDNDREPTEDEIEAASDDAYQNYVSGMADAACDAYKDSLYDKE